MDANGHWYGLTNAGNAPQHRKPRVIIIGAGSRGNSYAKAITHATSGVVTAVAEPIQSKREAIGKKYIWGTSTPQPHQQFAGWESFLAYEQERRKRVENDEANTEPGVDAACVCTLDTQHLEIILALAPLGLHLLSEKPLATTLQGCLAIRNALSFSGSESQLNRIFGVGHVLRYSPHNMLLRKLLLQDRVIGDVLSIEHAEPVGWWHFSHSYVRGHWRREDTTAPSLLTKSCHDIDLLLWLLCSPSNPEGKEAPHLPSFVSSVGHRGYFKNGRKPVEAGSATNCLQCPIESECHYSARKIYVEKHLRNGEIDWPVNIVEPEIEDIYMSKGKQAAEERLLGRLGEDYDVNLTSESEIKSRPWFGRCVWESDNDVCDDQTVNIVWEDGDEIDDAGRPINLAKTATFHQIAHTEAQCARRGRVYGSHGEITYDSAVIRVFNFATNATKEYRPTQLDFNDPIAKHGGGDTGLAQQFIGAIAAVKNNELSVDQAQKRYLGCTVEDVLRSHAMVFAAEDARNSKTVVDWKAWWHKSIEKCRESVPVPEVQEGIGGWQVVS